jgi:hypothetical protein
MSAHTARSLLGRPMSVVRLAALVISCGSVLNAQESDPPARHQRVITFSPDESIESRLRTDDDPVLIPYEFEADEPPPNMTAQQTVENIVARSSATLIVNVTAVKAVWVRKGTWIDTVLSGRVLRVVKQTGSEKFGVGQSVDAHVSGGEIKVGRTVVRVSFESSPTLPAPQEYLLFLNIDGVFALTYVPLLITDGKIAYAYRGRPANARTNSLDGLSEKTAIDWIRRWPLKPK